MLQLCTTVPCMLKICDFHPNSSCFQQPPDQVAQQNATQQGQGLKSLFARLSSLAREEEAALQVHSFHHLSRKFLATLSTMSKANAFNSEIYIAEPS